MAEKVGEIYYDVTLDLEQMIQDQRRAQQHLNKTADSLQQLAPIAAAAKAALSGLAVMKIIDVADQWGQYASRIKQATQSAEEYAYVQDRMLASANSTFRSVQETRESFIQLSPVLREMGLTLGQSVDVIDTFSGLLVVNAASAEKAKGAQDALAKSLQKGKIDADAWMSIYSTLDSVVDVIAESSGKSATEIRKLGVEGKLGVEVLVQALSDGSAQVAQQVKEMPTTVRDALQSVVNSMQEYVGWSNQTHGITATIATSVQALGENFTMLADAALVAVTAGLARYSGGIVVATAATVAKAVATSRAAAAEVVLAEAQVAQTAATAAQISAFRGVAVTQAQVVAATIAHEAATKRLAVAQAAQAAASATWSVAARGVLAFLGGPAGIAVAAGLAALAFVSLKGKTDESAAGLVNLKQPLDEVIDKFKELNSLQRERVINLQAEEIQAQAVVVRDAMGDLLSSFRAEIGSSGLAAAKFRSEFKREMLAAVGDASLSSDQLADAMKAIIDRWAEGMGWSEKLKVSMYAQAAAVVDLEGKQRKAIATNRELTGAHLDLADAAGQSAAAVSNAGKGTAEGNAAADKQIEVLKRQIALFGKTGTAAAIYYDLENGALREASAEKRAYMKTLADEMAAMEKRKKAQDAFKSAEKFDTGSYLLGLRSGASSSELSKIDADEKEALSKHKKLLDERKLNRQEHEEGVLLIQRKYANERAKLQEDELGGFIEKVEDAAKARADMERQAAELGRTLTESVQTPLERLNAELRSYDSLLAAGAISQETHARAAKKSQEEYEKNLNQMDQYTVRFAENVQDQLGDTIYNSLSGDFDNIGKAWNQMLLRMASQALAADLARSLFGGRVEGGSGSGLLGGALGAIGSFFGISGKRENGGTAAANRTYEVNERGEPELLTVGNKQMLMMAGQSGTVTPLGDGRMNVASVPTPAASVAVEFQVEVNNYGGGEVQQRRETQKMPDGRVLEKLVLDIVGESFANGTGAAYRGAKQRFNLRD